VCFSNPFFSAIRLFVHFTAQITFYSKEISRFQKANKSFYFVSCYISLLFELNSKQWKRRKKEDKITLYISCLFLPLSLSLAIYLASYPLLLSSVNFLDSKQVQKYFFLYSPSRNLCQCVLLWIASFYQLYCNCFINCIIIDKHFF